MFVSFFKFRYQLIEAFLFRYASGAVDEPEIEHDDFPAQALQTSRFSIQRRIGKIGNVRQ